ncbi:MAG: hypothetical protein PSY12_02275 [bacterium]|nr:hypothetical protein [bacterium]
MLFGVRLRSLFTSRWMALLWAILVILTAIQFVGVADAPDGQGDNAASAQDMAAQKDGLNSVF